MDGTQPAQAVALQNALQGLGSAFVQLGNAILAIDAGKGAATSDAVAGGKGKKRKVGLAPCAMLHGPAACGGRIRLRLRALSRHMC